MTHPIAPFHQPTFATLDDGPQLDAFGRLRVSETTIEFDTIQEYNAHPLLWEDVTANGGTATYTQAKSMTLLATGGTTANARAMRQTKAYWRYQPGRSTQSIMTMLLQAGAAPKDTAAARAGLYDDNNGLFVCHTASGMCAVQRSDTSGAVLDTIVPQALWNLDKLDGTGESGHILNPSKTQILMIDFQWLGAGRVRMGFIIHGTVHYFHEFLNTNVITSVYMRTPNLPMRYEVINDGGAGSAISMQTICQSLQTEGNPDTDGYTFAATMGGVAKSCANTVALTPLFSLRLVDTFGGLTYRGHMHMKELSATCATFGAYWELLLNATLTGATFANAVNSNSGVEYDTAATAISGGIRLKAGYFSASAADSAFTNTLADLSSKMILGRTYANVRDTITLAARGIGGAANVAAAINFSEHY